MNPKHLLPRNLLLVGYRGTGKSTIGKLVASKLQFPFTDTDIEIERVAGKSIAQIFSEDGEQSFRQLESDVLQSQRLLTCPTVISLGGGAIIREANRKCIQELGWTVWLQASPDSIHERIVNDSATQLRRPKLSNLGELDEIRAILSERWGWYDEVSEYVVHSDQLSVEQATESIVQWYRLRDESHR